MNCEHAIERLGERLDGVLPQAEAAELDGHLASCAACRAAMEDLRRSIEAVKALPKVKAPRGFAAGVMAEIRAEENASRDRAPAKVTPISAASVWTRLATMAAAILLVWAGVRAIHTTPSEKAEKPGDVAKEGAVDKVAKTDARQHADGVAPGENEALKKAGNTLAVLEEGKSKEAPASAAPMDKAAAAGVGADWGDHLFAGRNSPISVQRIVVRSSSLAEDKKQIQKLLSESGYTWTAQGGALILRTPASEAARFVASLDTATPGGFRAGGRKAAAPAESAGKPYDAARGADVHEPNRKPGDETLLADAGELKDALRKHLEESEKQIQHQESEKRRKDVAKAKDGGPAKNQEKKEGLRDRQEGGLSGGAPPPSAGDHNEADQKDAGAKADDPKKPSEPAIGGAEEGGYAKGGGSDELNSKTRKEQDLDDKLEREVRKLDEEKKLADQEEAVVIYIEFEEEVVPAPKTEEPSPAKK